MIFFTNFEILNILIYKTNGKQLFIGETRVFDRRIINNFLSNNILVEINQLFSIFLLSFIVNYINYLEIYVTFYLLLIL